MDEYVGARVDEMNVAIEEWNVRAEEARNASRRDDHGGRGEAHVDSQNFFVLVREFNLRACARARGALT